MNAALMKPVQELVRDRNAVIRAEASRQREQRFTVKEVCAALSRKYGLSTDSIQKIIYRREKNG